MAQMDAGPEHSGFPPASNPVGIYNAKQIHHSRGCNEPRAVISRSAENIWPGGFDPSRQEIEHARAGIRHEAQSAEGIARPRAEYFTPHSVPRHGKPSHRQE